jgi:hypothetical protein
MTDKMSYIDTSGMDTDDYRHRQQESIERERADAQLRYRRAIVIDDAMVRRAAYGHWAHLHFVPPEDCSSREWMLQLEAARAALVAALGGER